MSSAKTSKHGTIVRQRLSLRRTSFSDLLVAERGKLAMRTTIAAAKKKSKPPPKYLKEEPLAPELMAKANIAPPAPKAGSVNRECLTARQKQNTNMRPADRNNISPMTPDSASI
jgi:hypothetical protein